ncbi:MAG: helix-turn-helix transcriptional regulator [Chloroflexi bacterium]|nr:MAG: helix-turn-helix transcriptional regulator [Chloroflexota bacterium]
MRAAVALVAERGTTAVSISDIAEGADVSRQLVYLQFGDRDALLMEAALDLASRELLPRLRDAPEDSTGRSRAVATARHFADHRSFYRAMLTGSCGFALNRALDDLFMLLNRRLAEQLLDDSPEPGAADDLARYLTGGAAAVFNTWVIDGDDPLDPELFADRLLRMLAVLTGAARRGGASADQTLFPGGEHPPPPHHQ